MQFEKAEKIQHTCQENKSKANLNLKKVQKIFKLYFWSLKGKNKEKVTKCPLKAKCGKSPGTNALKELFESSMYSC